jgi:putative endonuclease
MPKKWFTYMVKCQDGTYYTGATNNLEHRLGQHNLGKGAKYTRARRPVKLVYSEQAADRSAALKREHEIKKLTRKQKEELVK